MIDRRRSLIGYQKSRLPGEYEELKYICSNSRTPKVTFFSLPAFNTSYTLSVDFELREKLGWARYFGVSDWYFTYQGYNTISRFVVNNTVVYTQEPLEAGVRQLFLWDNGTLYIDGTEVGSTTQTFNTQKILFFCNNTGDVASKMILYSVNNSLSGESVNELIPALRKSDNKPGMYDVVTKQFIVNEGSGEFGYETLDGVFVEAIG